MTDLNAAQFNRYHPVGTPVIAYPGVRPETADKLGLTPYDPDCGRPIRPDEYRRLVTVTRTPAWTLGHGQPVVSVNGYAGGISLEHIDLDRVRPKRANCPGCGRDYQLNNNGAIRHHACAARTRPTTRQPTTEGAP